MDHINPCTSFALCKDNKDLQERCGKILRKIASHQVKSDHGGYFISRSSGPARKVYLRPEMGGPNEWRIILKIYPADTMRQAQRFYSAVRSVDFLALQHKGWSIESNMHFSFVRRNLHRSTVELTPEQYLKYWCGNQEKIRQVHCEPSGFQALYQEFRSARLMSESDVHELENKLFPRTKLDRTNLCPGFELSFHWKSAEAIQLDIAGRFEEDVQSRIAEAMAT
jgi:hypothetical protein